MTRVRVSSYSPHCGEGEEGDLNSPLCSNTYFSALNKVVLLQKEALRTCFSLVFTELIWINVCSDSS